MSRFNLLAAAFIHIILHRVVETVKLASSSQVPPAYLFFFDSLVSIASLGDEYGTRYEL